MSRGTAGLLSSENIRDLTGIGYGDTVQTDSYDPSMYNLDLFTPDELFNSGNSLVAYYGFDYTGKEFIFKR